MLPDILLLQEVTTTNISIVRSTLPNHLSLSEISATYDVSSGGDILWNREILELIDDGFVNMECVEYPQRGLHWTRLKIHNSNIHVFACTAHLPWCGADLEVSTGVNSRIKATKRFISEYTCTLVYLLNVV